MSVGVSTIGLVLLLSSLYATAQVDNTTGISGGFNNTCTDATSQWYLAYGSPYYYFIPTNQWMNWTNARAYCRKTFGPMADLAVPYTADDIVLFQTMLSTAKINNFNPWIGGFQNFSAGNVIEPDWGWVWVTGDPVPMSGTPIAWASGSPSGAGNCTIYQNSRFKFYDVACNAGTRFICQLHSEKLLFLNVLII
jgi:hypothetical protein